MRLFLYYFSVTFMSLYSYSDYADVCVKMSSSPKKKKACNLEIRTKVHGFRLLQQNMFVSSAKFISTLFLVVKPSSSTADDIVSTDYIKLNARLLTLKDTMDNAKHQKCQLSPTNFHMQGEQ